MNKISNLKLNTTLKEYEKFKSQCIKIMDNITKYERKMFKDQFKNLYNKKIVILV